MVFNSAVCVVSAARQVSKVLVYIEERVKVADVTFPSRPIVLSLRDYDDADQASEHPIQGYPVVCVTVGAHFTT